VEKKGAFPLKRFFRKNQKERRSAMKPEISVTELVRIFKEIKGQPGQLYDMIKSTFDLWYNL